MSPTPTLYSIAPASTAGELSMTQVWQQGTDVVVPAGCTQIRALESGGETFLICAGGSGGASTLKAGSTAPYLQADQSSIAIGGPWDQLEPFVLGNEPYLLTYDAKEGNIFVYPLADDLTASTPYQFFRKRPPAISIGFDMITPIVVLGGVYFLGYIKQSGDVRAYSLVVTATNPPSAPGTPPLLATPVWDHQWAPDWTRFAFFYLGGEVFFFKVNDGKLNVNIDHLVDTPALGTVEVGSYLQGQLPDALQIDLARAFYIAGDPYLLMYKQDGSTDLYRVRGDCQGWTMQASLTTVQGATQVVPYQVGDGTFVLFY